MKRFNLLLVFLLAFGETSYTQPLAKQGAGFLAKGMKNSALRSPGLLDVRSFLQRVVRVPLPVAPYSPLPLSESLLPVTFYRVVQPASQALLSKRNVDAFIFDLDGTLLNSLGAWENAASNYLKTRGIYLPTDLQRQIEQLSLTDGALLLKERYHFEESPEELVAATIRPVGEHYYHDIPAKTMVPALLSHLRAQGIKMAVATASHADFARGALKRLDLLDYFEFIITCDEVGAGKTDPRVYEEARKRLGVEKARTVVVEDAPYALETAHDAGFKTIGVAEEHYQDKAVQMRKIADLFLDFDK